jgi:hypothetical protein
MLLLGSARGMHKEDERCIQGLDSKICWNVTDCDGLKHRILEDNIKKILQERVGTE